MRTPELQIFINKFASYSKSVLKHIRATLSVLMRTGVDWEYVERNPVIGLKLPPGKPVKRAPVLPVEKLGELIARLPEPYRTMAVLGTTGMRESEILGLRWDDFDTDKSGHPSTSLPVPGPDQSDEERKKRAWASLRRNRLRRSYAATHIGARW